MARIRTIKPEFPHSESVGRVSREARLLFIQLWTICDDSGRTRGNSRILASLLYPYDEDAAGLIDGWLVELERENCVARYAIDGSTYLQVLNWRSHQRIDKPTESKIPEFAEGSRLTREDSTKPPGGLPVGLEGKGREGRGGEGAVAPPVSLNGSSHPERKGNPKGTRIPEGWEPATEGLKLPEDFDLDGEAEKFRDYWRSRPGQGGVKLDWSATWRNWVRRAVDESRYARSASAVARSSAGPRLLT